MALQPHREALGGFRTGTIDQARVDDGLRSYMLKVYNYMASGLALSGIVGVALALNPQVLVGLVQGGLGLIVMLAPLGLLLIMSFAFKRLGTTAMQALYWGFTGLFGVSIATVFLVYTPESVMRVFFITAATFGAMSLYGYTTKRDLSGFGNFLLMGLIGLIIASVVNIFMESSMLAWMISVIGVLVFVGLTAFDTQRIKVQYIEYVGNAGIEVANKTAIMGAVSLYLNFINLFMFLLHLMGNRE